MTTFSQLNIDLRQIILAIENAVSLVGMNDTNHGKRVGYIASQLAKQLNFDELDIQFAFDLGLLHDCGVSSDQVHANLVNQFDWCDCHIHSEIGYRLVKDFKPLARFALPILHHHTHWSQLHHLDLPAFDKRMANLIFLADRIDILAASHYDTDILLARTEIIKTVTSYSGDCFNPDFVQAFNDIADSEAFWIALADRHITRYVWDMGNITSNRNISIPELKQLSLILAYIVDQKSRFTAEHSIRVASLARYLATVYGLLPEQCEQVEIAGLLHDLGKLHTPDRILEKPGPLDEIERSIMSQHSYETYEILRHIQGLDDIACWAAFHHEGLNGVGYPFHPAERDLSVEARIIAVADIFQALVQDRPYRQGLALKEVIQILDDFVDKGKLDPTIVDFAKLYQDDCFDICQGRHPEHNLSAITLYSATAVFDNINDSIRH